MPVEQPATLVILVSCYSVLAFLLKKKSIFLCKYFERYSTAFNGIWLSGKTYESCQYEDTKRWKAEHSVLT
ncbi:unnamed protein product [Larinioides sclopetarius]|uniref:Secreted protein n=1 Tax=Larinioides sclopetarius TaxID=280406 RepID=A0AAV2BWZ4_9ARAC